MRFGRRKMWKKEDGFGFGFGVLYFPFCFG